LTPSMMTVVDIKSNGNAKLPILKMTLSMDNFLRLKLNISIQSLYRARVVYKSVTVATVTALPTLHSVGIPTGALPWRLGFNSVLFCS